MYIYTVKLPGSNHPPFSKILLLKRGGRSKRNSKTILFILLFIEHCILIHMYFFNLSFLKKAFKNFGLFNFFPFSFSSSTSH